MRTFEVTTEDIGKRIDTRLTEIMTPHTRGDIVRSLKSEKILVNSKAVKPSYKLRANDTVTAEEIEVVIDSLIPNLKMTLDIVDETDDFLVINKPRGIQVHPSTTEKLETITNALVARHPEIATVGDETEGINLRPGIVSRLDKYTSGLMVIAKNQEAFDALKASFAAREVHKTYHAFVWGVPKEPTGTIDAPIARAVGYTRQKVAFGKFTGDAKEAVTNYETRATHDASDIIRVKNGEPAPQISHIILHPQTGRMHQLRVHMAHIGRSIIGDIKYERKNEKALNKKLFDILPEDDFKTFYLHAGELSFNLNGEDHTYKLPLPEHFEFVLQLLDA